MRKTRIDKGVKRTPYGPRTALGFFLQNGRVGESILVEGMIDRHLVVTATRKNRKVKTDRVAILSGSLGDPAATPAVRLTITE